MVVPNIKLSNGHEMPSFGLGTLQFRGSEGGRAIKDAIDAGYRHFDTAYAYGNEMEIGQAIRDKIDEGIVSREDIFIVTKIYYLWNIFHDPDKVEYACRKSLTNLGLGYIDLYLIHFPIGFVYHDDERQWPRGRNGKQEVSDVDYIDTWKAMEKLVNLRLVRSIGISNFNSQQIERILSISTIPPVVNQVECSPSINQKKLVKFCKDRNIVVTAYSPLGHLVWQYKTPKYIFDPIVQRIAEKYGKTTPQVVLRYLVEIGVVPIPKSVTKERIQQNIDIFNFNLTEEEHKILDSFNTGARMVDMSDSSHSKFYPFNIEF